MIRTQSDRPLSLAEFDWPFQSGLDEHNRWVKMSQCIPWDELAQAHYEGLSSQLFFIRLITVGAISPEITL